MKTGIVCTLLGAVAGWVVGCYLWEPLVRDYRALYQSANERSEYYSMGALRNGVLNFCEGRVRFIDECGPD